MPFDASFSVCCWLSRAGLQVSAGTKRTFCKDPQAVRVTSLSSPSYSCSQKSYFEKYFCKKFPNQRVGESVNYVNVVRDDKKRRSFSEVDLMLQLRRVASWKFMEEMARSLISASLALKNYKMKLKNIGSWKSYSSWSVRHRYLLLKMVAH